MTRGTVEAICISERKGTAKTPITQGYLEKNYGLKDDAHAGNWHRQVSLLAVESIEKMRKIGLDVSYGSFGENICTSGLELHKLPTGSRLQVGSEVLLEVTQIGKECHRPCAIGRATGKCIMPEEGIFSSVLKGGKISSGDKIVVILSNEIDQ
jgi:MOSC domain-containing protein YiiM